VAVPLPILTCGHDAAQTITKGINAGACKICIHRQRASAYYRNNPEKVSAYWKRKRESGHDWRRLNVEKALFNGAKQRAKIKGHEFSITVDDIVIPETCPVLGIKLQLGGGRTIGASPTIDRVNNAFGYVKGNIVVMSWRANRIKSDATPEEIEALAKWVKKLCK